MRNLFFFILSSSHGHNVPFFSGYDPVSYGISYARIFRLKRFLQVAASQRSKSAVSFSTESRDRATQPIAGGIRTAREKAQLTFENLRMNLREENAPSHS